MKIPKHLLTIASILALAAIVQANPFTKLDFLIGHWSGSGSGFGNTNSETTSEFKYIMDGKFLKLRHLFLYNFSN